MRGFVRAIESGELLIRQVTPASVIEKVGRRAVKILQIENGSFQEVPEESTFCDAVTVEVGETRHSFAHYCKQIVILYVTVVPINAVQFRAVRHHVVRTLKTVHLGRICA